MLSAGITACGDRSARGVGEGGEARDRVGQQGDRGGFVQLRVERDDAAYASAETVPVDAGLQDGA
jgi:hypothetical protein